MAKHHDFQFLLRSTSCPRAGITITLRRAVKAAKFFVDTTKMPALIPTLGIQSMSVANYTTDVMSTVDPSGIVLIL